LEDFWRISGDSGIVKEHLMARNTVSGHFEASEGNFRRVSDYLTGLWLVTLSKDA